MPSTLESVAAPAEWHGLRFGWKEAPNSLALSLKAKADRDGLSSQRLRWCRGSLFRLGSCLIMRADLVARNWQAVQETKREKSKAETAQGFASLPTNIFRYTFTKNEPSSIIIPRLKRHSFKRKNLVGNAVVSGLYIFLDWSAITWSDFPFYRSILLFTSSFFDQLKWQRKGLVHLLSAPHIHSLFIQNALLCRLLPWLCLAAMNQIDWYKVSWKPF